MMIVKKLEQTSVKLLPETKDKLKKYSVMLGLKRDQIINIGLNSIDIKEELLKVANERIKIMKKKHSQ